MSKSCVVCSRGRRKSLGKGLMYNCCAPYMPATSPTTDGDLPSPSGAPSTSRAKPISTGPPDPKASFSNQLSPVKPSLVHHCVLLTFSACQLLQHHKPSIKRENHKIRGPRITAFIYKKTPSELKKGGDRWWNETESSPRLL